MKRRLLEAYEQITMPHDCASRIEWALKRRQEAPGRRRYARAMKPSGGWGWWGAAAALVGLVVLASALGTFLALNGPAQTAQPTVETLPSTEQPPTETAAGAATAEFTDAGISFQYPAHWEHTEQRGEDGGADSFYDPQTGRAVFTLRRSEAWLVDMTRDQTAYQETLRLTWPDAVVLSLERASVGGAEANRVEYVYSDGKTSQSITRYDVVANAVGYVFEYSHASAQETALPQEVETLLSSVRFGDESDDAAFTLVEDFADAYFSGEEQTLRTFLAADFSGAIEVYGGDAAARVLQTQAITVTEERASYSVTFLESAESDSYSYLVVELVNTDAGWKVSFYGLEK